MAYKPESTAMISPFLSDTLIGMAAEECSVNLEFPIETSTLMALSVASFVVGTSYCVTYPDGEGLPIGLYALAEQPSGTGKSGVFKKLMRGYRDGLRAEDIKRKKERTAILQSKTDKGELDPYEEAQLELNHEIGEPISNTTPEALDAQLHKQKGWFSVASTEQGLLNTLIGGMYNDGKKSFDLLLKGFNAEEHHELRVTRETFNGIPHGGACCVSQDGSILTVLENSGTTGLVERFLMVIEGDMRGHRNFNVGVPSWSGLHAFNAECKKIISDGFSEKRSLDFSQMKKLKISRGAWDSICDQRRDIETELGEGGRYRAHIFSSMWSKFDIQVMKIAATIHAFSAKDINSEIGQESVETAIVITKEILRGVVKICEMKGIVGKSSEESDLEEYMSKNCSTLMGKPEKTIIDSVRRRKVFTQYGNEARSKVKQALESLIKKGLIQEVKTANSVKLRYLG